MSENKQECCCCEGGSEEQTKYEQIAQVIDAYKDRPGSLIMVLHAAQQIYGYLPIELQKFIADGMGLALSEVYGVVSFYSFFSTKERGAHTLRVCLGTACYVRGGKKLVDALQDKFGMVVGETTPDKNFTFEIARCIGACGLAPAMMVDDKVYKQVSPAKLGPILAAYNDANAEGGAAV
jgi:NADH:ubiquinone oxidoreductase subunit E